MSEMKYTRPYEVLHYETGPRTCDRCGGMRPVWMLNQYPKISRSKSPREVCRPCLERDKHDGTFVVIMDKWENRVMED